MRSARTRAAPSSPWSWWGNPRRQADEGERGFGNVVDAAEFGLDLNLDSRAHSFCVDAASFGSSCAKKRSHQVSGALQGPALTHLSRSLRGHGRF